MPVKRVPGGYKLIPHREDPGGRRRKKEFKTEEQMAMMEGPGGGPEVLGPGILIEGGEAPPPPADLGPGSLGGGTPVSFAKAGGATQLARARSVPRPRPGGKK